MSKSISAQPVPRSVIFVVLCSVFAILSLATYWAFRRHAERPMAIAGRPLLASDPVFVDEQLGWRFTPPSDWAMQARSVDSPDNPRPERMIVKYKQFVPGQPAAWLRISVAANDKGKTASDWLRDRKPPESTWKRTKEIEGDLLVGQLPAARITFVGPFDTDGRGQREYTCETTTVVAKKRVYFFAGYFPTGDTQSQKRIRDALTTLEFAK